MQLYRDDLKWIVRRMPIKLVKVMMAEAGLVLGGGFIRSCIANEKINDIDLFVESKERAEYITGVLKTAFGCNVVKTDNANTIRANPYTIQVIHRWVFEKPEDIVKSFDFTIACAAVWFQKTEPYSGGVWQSLINDRFYADLAAKRLVYLSPIRNEDAGGSILRVLKFYQAGYRIPLDSFGNVIARLVGAVDFDKTPPDEASVGRVITGLLREVDPSLDHEAYFPPESNDESDDSGNLKTSIGQE